MEKEGAKRMEIKGFDDKRQLTAVFGATIAEKLLPMQFIYQGKTNEYHPKVRFQVTGTLLIPQTIGPMKHQW